MQIPDLAALENLGVQLRSEGKCIGWTNGCFDLIHPGHLSTFKYLRERTDFVVVGLNSDISPYFATKPGRPIHDQDFRVAMLIGLRDIDAVYVYSDENPIPSLLALQPHFCVKGGDYIRENMVEYPIIRHYGGILEVVPTLAGYSSTQSIQKIIRTYS